MSMGLLNYRECEKREVSSFIKYFKESLKDLFNDHYSENSIGYIVDVDYGPKWMKKQLELGKKKVFLCFSEKKIVGYLFVTRPAAGVSFADWLAVDKSYQRKGIAGKLLLIWENYALNEGAHSLYLWTTKINLDYYRKRKFKVVGEFPNAWHGVDSFLIIKNLTKPKEENFLKNYLKNKTKK